MDIRRLIYRAAACALAGLVSLNAACGDSVGPEDAGIASISLSGAPPGPILAGTTVQLIATPLNETGGAISNKKISWSSSDTAIASVNTNGLVTASGAGPVTITASVGKKSGSMNLDIFAGGPVGADGGTVTMKGGLATLAVEPRSVFEAVTILIRPATAIAQDSRGVPGSAIEVAPGTLFFSRPAKLSIRFDPGKIPNGLPEASLQLYSYANGGWNLVRQSSVDTVTNVVSGNVSRGGTYAVVSTPVNRITIGGPVAEGALYTGQTGELQALLFDVNGDTIRGRSISWSSETPSVASIDGRGKVSALSAGTANLKASVEDKAATTTLVVLQQPAASWSHTTEWATHQGGPLHTGAVSATVDPGVFKVLWDIDTGGGALNPPAEGDGRVYVSSNLYFGDQKAFAFDLGTGARRWSHSFGNIASAHPPAFGNNRVYIATGGHSDSYVYGFDAATGALQFRSTYGNQWSRWYAPVIVGNTVYSAGGYYGGLSAFDATTGDRRWSTATAQYDQWTPAVRDNLVYAYTTTLTVYHAATGTLSYSVADPGFNWGGYDVNASPALGSNNNLFITQGGRLLSFDLANRSIGWQRNGQYRNNVTVADGVLYVWNGNQVEARKESDGSQLWLWPLPAGETPLGTVIATKNILFVSSNRRTYAVDMTARRATWSHPAGGHLAVARTGVLLIAQGTGKLTAVSLK
jgi:hypothetical protein